jgi:hypothetical protein
LYHECASVARGIEHHGVKLCTLDLKTGNAAQRFESVIWGPMKESPLGTEELLIFNSLSDPKNIKERQHAGTERLADMRSLETHSGSRVTPSLWHSNNGRCRLLPLDVWISANWTDELEDQPPDGPRARDLRQHWSKSTTVQNPRAMTKMPPKFDIHWSDLIVSFSGTVLVVGTARL